MINNINYINRGTFDVSKIDINQLYKGKDVGEYGIIESKDTSGNITSFYTLEVRPFIDKSGKGGCIQKLFKFNVGKIQQRFGRIVDNRVTWTDWQTLMDANDIIHRDNRLNAYENDKNNLWNRFNDNTNRLNQTNARLNDANNTNANLRNHVTQLESSIYNVNISKIQNIRASAIIHVNINVEQFHQGRHAAYFITAIDGGSSIYSMLGNVRVLQVTYDGVNWMNCNYG